MSNCISADTPFYINHRQVELQALFLLLCATDGCFAYVRSPMHFEHLLLSTLQDARDAESWRRALEVAVTAVTGDDAALALLGLGADLDGFKQLFKDRAEELGRRYIDPLDELDGQVQRAEQELEGLRPADRARGRVVGHLQARLRALPGRRGAGRRGGVVKAGDVINGYRILEDFRVVGAGLE